MAPMPGVLGAGFKMTVQPASKAATTLPTFTYSGTFQGVIAPTLPPLVVLYTLYARACDPVLGFLKGSGQHSAEEIIEMVLSTCFDGLKSR